MSKGNYLGGSTVIRPREDPYRIENTAPLTNTDSAKRLVFFFGEKIDNDLVKELDGFDYHYLSGMFSAVQHAFVHGDLSAIVRFAEPDEYLGNYTLRIANHVMVGRKFDRRNGKIIILKDGKLDWKIGQLISIYRAMIAVYDREADEAIELHPSMIDILREAE